MEATHDTELLTTEKTVTKKETSKSIVLYNDDENSFEWVIVCLNRICGHNHEQAEQCALIVHNRGKFSIKEGNQDTLLPLHRALLDAGLTTEIV